MSTETPLVNAGCVSRDAIPERFTLASQGTPSGEAFNVGQIYALFARAIRSGESRLPNFANALELHHLVDAIKRASDTGSEASFG